MWNWRDKLDILVQISGFNAALTSSSKMCLPLCYPKAAFSLPFSIYSICSYIPTDKNSCYTALFCFVCQPPFNPSIPTLQIPEHSKIPKQKYWASAPFASVSDNWQKGGGLGVSKFSQVFWNRRTVHAVSVAKGKAVKRVHTLFSATELRETTSTRNTLTLGKALVSGYHQLQTWN